MPDEMDAWLRRRFIDADEALPADPFVGQLVARFGEPRRGRPAASTATSILATVIGGLTSGLLAPLQMRHAGKMAAASAAMALWATLF